MIPETLKHLLEPWLKQIDTALLIDYIRQQTLADNTISRATDDLSDDMPTAALRPNEVRIVCG